MGLGRLEQPFKTTGALSEVRETFGIAVLPGDRVMVAGGFATTAGTILNEQWDPATGVWTKKRDLKTQRSFTSATTLPSGKVLVLGGSEGTGESYDPTIDEWTVIAEDGGYGAHRPVLLPNGKVLVVGRRGSDWTQPRLYDPVTDVWSSGGTMVSPRENFEAHVLYDGRVAIFGGYNATDTYLSSVEIYTPATNTWSAGGALKNRRQGSASAVLGDKRILVAGGYNGGALSSAEIYDPITNTTALTSSLSVPRAGALAVALSTGRVLVIGGDNGTNVPYSSSEVYDPVTKAWSPGPSLVTARYNFGTAVLSGGRILVVGGKAAAGALSAAEVFGGLATGDACVIDEECTSAKCEATKCAAAPVVDAGADAADTGVEPVSDTGVAPQTPPKEEEGGCGCRTSGRDSTGGTLLALSCAIAAIVRRRDNGSSGERQSPR